jgi:hypothetical protein
MADKDDWKEYLRQLIRRPNPASVRPDDDDFTSWTLRADGQSASWNESDAPGLRRIVLKLVWERQVLLREMNRLYQQQQKKARMPRGRRDRTRAEQILDLDAKEPGLSAAVVAERKHCDVSYVRKVRRRAGR